MSVKERVIRTHACIREGCDWLSANDPDMARAIGLIGRVPLRRNSAGFSRLFQAIVGQQLSIAAARTIWGRVEAAGVTSPEAIMASRDDALRALGLSSQKIGYARSLAEADINYRALGRRSTPEVVNTLTAVKGIGVWTAEIYAMFSLGRADTLAAGDLALQEAARKLKRLAHRPTEKQLRELAEGWSPWRGVAARVLWEYYRTDDPMV